MLFSYVTCAIDQKKLTKVAKYYQKKSSYSLDASIMVHNCTTAATGAWNKVCPLADRVVPDNLPADLKLQIKLLKNSGTGTSLIGSGLISKSAERSNVFYMDKDGSLMPLALEESADLSGATRKSTSSSIQAAWKQVKAIPNLHTTKSLKFANGYLLKYKKASAKKYKMRFLKGLNKT